MARRSRLSSSSSAPVTISVRRSPLSRCSVSRAMRSRIRTSATTVAASRTASTSRVSRGLATSGTDSIASVSPATATGATYLDVISCATAGSRSGRPRSVSRLTSPAASAARILSSASGTGLDAGKPGGAAQPSTFPLRSSSSTGLSTMPAMADVRVGSSSPRRTISVSLSWMAQTRAILSWERRSSWTACSVSQCSSALRTAEPSSSPNLASSLSSASENPGE